MIQKFERATGKAALRRFLSLLLSLALILCMALPTAQAAVGTKAAKAQASAKTSKSAKASKAAKSASAKKSGSSKKATARPAQRLNLAEQPSDESREALLQRGIFSAFGWRSLRGGKRSARFHCGIDISAPKGSAIQAYDGGTVTFSGRKSGYGICVIIDHGEGLTSLYAHMAATGLNEGDEVGRGEEVGKVGRTGRTTGAHLHFELLRDGKNLNPANYVQDGRELVLAAHMGPGATEFAGIPVRKAGSASLAVATIEASKKFTKESRLGLPSAFGPQDYSTPFYRTN